MEIKEAYIKILEREEEMLSEGMFKKAIVGAAIVGAGLFANHSLKQEVPAPVATAGKIEQVDPVRESLVKKVLSKYKINKDKAHEIVGSVLKHADPVFPKAHDLLAVIGKESTFNEHAVSNLKTDKAKGLTQVRPGIWGLKSGELDTIDGQVKQGAKILRKYHEKLGTPDAAFHAYNVGIGNYRRGKNLNPDYVTGVNKERKLYE